MQTEALSAKPPAHRDLARGLGARGLRRIFFTLEAIHSVATAYYFNYLFFYMRDHFGFDNRNNLLLTALHGGVYMISAWNAGRLAQRWGYVLCLRLGFGGMGAALTLGILLPKFLGYSRAAMFAQFGVLVCWTMSMCLTWAPLQALVSRNVAPTRMPRTAGIYNVIWAAGAALSYLTGGVLLEKFGGEVLFAVAAGLHLLQLVLLSRVPTTDLPAVEAARPEAPAEPAPAMNPRPIAKARTFMYLALLSNPFAYVAINGIVPVIPKLSASLGLSHAWAGLVCSVWLWFRLGAFVLFWLWPGWHYRFRWLFTAFISLAVSFAVMLLSHNLWMLVPAEVLFGLAVGLIYYSSLFYSMDVGETRGKRGGLHEAVIGMGVCAGPTVGVTALCLLPSFADAGTWAISALLAAGLVPLMLIRRKGLAGAKGK